MNIAMGKYAPLIERAVSDGTLEGRDSKDFERHRNELLSRAAKNISAMGAVGEEVCAGLKEIISRNPDLTLAIIHADGINARIAGKDTAICDVKYTIGGMFGTFFVTNHITRIVEEVSPKKPEGVVLEAARAVGNYRAVSKSDAGPVVV